MSGPQKIHRKGASLSTHSSAFGSTWSIFGFCCTTPVEDDIGKSDYAAVVSYNPMQEKMTLPSESELRAASKILRYQVCDENGLRIHSRLIDKDQEKERVRCLVEQFAARVSKGYLVSLVRAETGWRSPHEFSMDEDLKTFTLRPIDGASLAATVCRFPLEDIVRIYKDEEVAKRAPFLGKASLLCVGLDSTPELARQFFFYIEETEEREQFCTCLTVLRMAVNKPVVDQPVQLSTTLPQAPAISGPSYTNGQVGASTNVDIAFKPQPLLTASMPKPPVATKKEETENLSSDDEDEISNLPFSFQPLPVIPVIQGDGPVKQDACRSGTPDKEDCGKSEALKQQHLQHQRIVPPSSEAPVGFYTV